MALQNARTKIRGVRLKKSPCDTKKMRFFKQNHARLFSPLFFFFRRLPPPRTTAVYRPIAGNRRRLPALAKKSPRRRRAFGRGARKFSPGSLPYAHCFPWGLQKGDRAGCGFAVFRGVFGLPLPRNAQSPDKTNRDRKNKTGPFLFVIFFGSAFELPSQKKNTSKTL